MNEAKAELKLENTVVPRRILLTAHGIRTHGQWQERLAAMVSDEDPSTVAVHYKYGFFSTLAFIIPFTRYLITRRFRATFLRVAAEYPEASFDIVAHSFGTHIVAWGLHGMTEAERPRIGTIIFAGSVLKPDFPWDTLLYGAGKVRRVINDCGIGDSVLALNQLTVLFTGMAGRIGFSGMMGDNFLNRWFQGGHSHYFEDDTFMRRYWLPVLTSPNPPLPVDERRPLSTVGGAFLFLLKNATPIKMALYAFVMILPTAWVYSLYISEAEQRIEADLQRAEAVRQKNDALRTIEWVIHETAKFEFDRFRFDKDSERLLFGLMKRLKDTGYDGRVEIAAHVGQFCVIQENNDEPRLAPPSTPIDECQKSPSNQSYSLALGQRMADGIREAFRNLAVPHHQMSSLSYGAERPLWEYPTLGTAQQWNRVARLNNRLEVRLLDLE